MLKQKLISYHDEKTKSESFINEDYLEYLALKYTSKTMKDICDTHDTKALETIINHLKKKPNLMLGFKFMTSLLPFSILF